MQTPAQAPQKTISVEVPGLGQVEFPEGTAPDVMEKAIREATGWRPPDPTGGRSAASRATGGFLNAAGLNPLPLLQLGAQFIAHPVDTTANVAKSVVAPLGRLGNVGDAFRKGGLTGAANEVAASIPLIGPAAEQASQRWKSGDVAGGAGETAGLIFGLSAGPALVKGAVTQGAKTATRTAEGLMQSALKPGVGKMRDVIRGKASVPPVVKTLLDEGITVSDSGVGKLTRLINSNRDELNQALQNSNAVVFPQDVAGRAMTSRARVGNQVNNIADVRAFDDAIDEFVRTYGGVTGAKPMPVSQAQSLKVGTYANLKDKAYGELKSGSIEGQKALARGLKEEIEAALPNTDVRGINQRLGRLEDAQEPLGRRVALAGNRDPGGLAPLAPRAENFLAMLFLRNPAAKSLVARGLYRSAAQASKVPEHVIRAAVQAVALAGRDDE